MEADVACVKDAAEDDGGFEVVGGAPGEGDEAELLIGESERHVPRAEGLGGVGGF